MFKDFMRFYREDPKGFIGDLVGVIMIIFIIFIIMLLGVGFGFYD